MKRMSWFILPMIAVHVLSSAAWSDSPTGEWITSPGTSREVPFTENLASPDMAAGTGELFEVRDEEGSRITVSCTDPITAVVQYLRGSLTVAVSRDSSLAAARMTIEGLDAERTYHLYINDLRQPETVQSDVTGRLNVDLDLTVDSVIMVREQPSTYFVTGDGWTDSGGTDLNGVIGTWDPVTRTAVLTVDTYEMIQVDADNVVLDGSGRFGDIYVYDQRDIEIRNFAQLGRFLSRAEIYYSENITVHHMEADRITIGYSDGCRVADNIGEIRISYSGNNEIAGNYGANYFNHIELRMSHDNYLHDNTSVANRTGISIDRSSGNTLRANTMTGNEYGFNLGGGLDSHFEQDIDKSNTVDGKSIYYLRDVDEVVIGPADDPALVYVFNGKRVTIRDITLSGSGHGVYFRNVSDSVIYNVHFDRNWVAIRFVGSHDNSVRYCRFTENEENAYYGLFSSRNVLESNEITGVRQGPDSIYYYGQGFQLGPESIDNIVSRNYFKDLLYGFSLSGDGDSRFYLPNTGNRIVNNYFRAITWGAETGGKNEDTLVEGNTFFNCWREALQVKGTVAPLIKNNTFIENGIGMELISATGVRMRDNLFEGNFYSFGVYGAHYTLHKEEHYHHDIDTSNLVDGRPIYYMVGQPDVDIGPEDAPGYVALVECAGARVHDVTISRAEQGVLLMNTVGSVIEDVLFRDNYIGIEVNRSQGNVIRNNEVVVTEQSPAVTRNEVIGIDVLDSSGNLFSKNSVHDIERGWEFSLTRSPENRVEGNYLAGGEVGISLNWQSSGNTLFNNTMENHDILALNIVQGADDNVIINNNFLDSGRYHVYQRSEAQGNVFNGDRCTGGNFWSGWEEPDNDGDGFVDFPYQVERYHGTDYLPWKMRDAWLDTLPPVTTVTLTGPEGADGWFIGPVTMTLTAEDNTGGIGVVRTEYSLDGVRWDTYAGPVSIGHDGIASVFVRSADARCNVEPDLEVVIRIDSGAPSVTCPQDVSVEQETVDGVPAASLSLVDFFAGFSAWDAVDDDPAVSSDAPGVFTFGTTPVTFTAVDAAGHDASCTAAVIVIATVPPEVDAGPDFTHSADLDGTYLVTLDQARVEDLIDPSPAIAWKYGGEVIGRSLAMSHPFAIGEHALTLVATNRFGKAGSDTVVVTINKRTSLLVPGSEDAGTYSDPVLLGAALFDVTPDDPAHGNGRPMEDAVLVFGLPDGAVLEQNTDSTGNARVQFAWDDPALPAGPYALLYSYAGDAVFKGDAVNADITIYPEPVELEYTGDQVITTGAEAFLERATVTQPDDGYPVDYSAGRVDLLFELLDFTGQAIPHLSTAAPVMDAYGNVAFAQTLAANPGEGIYSVRTSVYEEAYVTAVPDETALVVFEPSGQFVTGGGWFTDGDGDGHRNFGLNYKYNRNGSPKGSLLLILRDSERLWRIKSNALTGIGFTGEDTAVVQGKCNLVVVDRVTGMVLDDESMGGLVYYLALTDGDIAGGAPDTLLIQVRDRDGFPVEALFMEAPSMLGGGNITIHSR